MQKAWYDCNAKDRELSPGDRVLVLLPTSTNKLLVEWQGPYSISRRVGRVTYEVDMKDRRRRKRIYHINMLHEWVAQDAPGYWVDEVIKEEDDDIVCWESEGKEEPLINDFLSHQQMTDSAAQFR